MIPSQNSGRAFRDKRLMVAVNSIIPFSRESVTKAIRDLLQTLSPFGSEEQVYVLTFLEMLNAITVLFSALDSYFNRGVADVGTELVNDLMNGLISDLGKDARLAGAGITTSLNNAKTEAALGQELRRLRTGKLTTEDCDRLQAVQDILTYSLMKPYLPAYVQDELDRMPEAIDQAVRSQLGPNFGRDELGRLAAALVKVGKSYGNRVKAAPEEVQKYGPMVLTPQQFYQTTLERLYGFPPFLIQQDVGKFVFLVIEHPFLWIRKRELEFYSSMKQRHPNVSGDSTEKIIAEFLTRRQLVYDDTPPSGFEGVVRPHPHHFVTAKSIRLSRNTREDIFGVLAHPQQPALEIDIVANHAEGFSVLGESKFVTVYSNAEERYYRGSDAKEAEQTRLLNLTRFLNSHPERKSEFQIPFSNPIVPVFITNAIGPLFSDGDGVVKACTWEVMRVEPFYRLVRRAITQFGSSGESREAGHTKTS